MGVEDEGIFALQRPESRREPGEDASEGVFALRVLMPSGGCSHSVFWKPNENNKWAIALLL